MVQRLRVLSILTEIKLSRGGNRELLNALFDKVLSFLRPIAASSNMRCNSFRNGCGVASALSDELTRIG